MTQSLCSSYEELVRDHAVAADLYAKYWAHSESRPEGMSDEEAGYFLLLHTGMLYRYTGDSKPIKILRALEFAKRERLVCAACHFLAASDYAEKAKQLAVAAETDEAAEEEFEQYVYERDQVDTLMRTIQLFSNDVLQSSNTAGKAYEEALQVELALDTVLEEHPGVTATCSQTVLGLKEYVVVDGDNSHAWWFFRLEQIMRNVLAPSDVEILIASHAR